MSERRQYDADQDKQVEDSFPASDPPSTTPIKGPGRTKEVRKQGAAEEAHDAKGHPTDDRLASETTSARVQGIHPPETDHR